jgi:DNA-binding CsgD family transcriptional regulator
MSVTFPNSIVLELIGRIYDAAGDAGLWPAFLERLADIVDGTTTQLFLYDHEHRSGHMSAAVRSDPTFQQRYNDYYISIDAYATHGGHLIGPGKVFLGQQMCPDGLLASSEFYNDFMRTEDIFHQFCGFVFKDESVASVISVLRPKRKGPFGEENVELLNVLMPHLQRALRIHRRISGVEQRAAAAAAGLDRMPVGFLIIDAFGEVLLSNQKAREALEQNDGLTLNRAGLAARRREETDLLRAMIRGAITRGTEDSMPAGGIMTISRPSGRRSFAILVAPAPRVESPFWPEGPAAAIFINDPDALPEEKSLALRRQFGLSRAEARLASGLMQGKTLDEAAKEFQVSRNTVRSQLQSLFEKTGTTRQGELVRLFCASLAQLGSQKT